MNIHQYAVVHPDAKIGKDVKIGPFVTIDANVEIGDGTIIDSGAVVRSGARIGKNCHIHSNAVVGDIPRTSSSKARTRWPLSETTRLSESLSPFTVALLPRAKPSWVTTA